MDAVLATNVAGGQAQIPLNIEVDVYKLISTLIQEIKQNPSMAALDKVWVGRRGSIKSTLLEGQVAPPPW